MHPLPNGQPTRNGRRDVHISLTVTRGKTGVPRRGTDVETEAHANKHGRVRFEDILGTVEMVVLHMRFLKKTPKSSISHSSRAAVIS